jgi:YesN/AraC family two-component response regulator
MVFKDEFNVIAFDNGKVAQKEIKNKMPDIIISDIMMPGISGTDLTSIIKNEIETSHIPVILLTAKTSDNDIIEGLKTGADSYLTKPFNADVLKAQVNSLLKARRSFREKFSGKLSIDPVDVKITPMDDEFLKNLIKITEERMSDPNFDVGVLIHEMNMSHSVLLKKVKFLTDMSIVEFIRSMRIKRAAQIFKQDNLSVSDVAYMVGFSDPKYFSKCFAQFIGEKPKAFVKRYHF